MEGLARRNDRSKGYSSVMEHPEELTARVYDELRALAAAQLRRERRGHTLQATALAHEAYLRLSGQQRFRAFGRDQFLALAARMIRRILVDHARKRDRAKRGGGKRAVTLDDALAMTSDGAVDLLDLHSALERLSTLDERQARVVELRFFGGLGVDDVARLVGVSPRTVDNEWRAARAWLRRELS